MILHWLDIVCVCIFIGASKAKEFSLTDEHYNKKLDKSEIEKFTSVSIQTCVRKCRQNRNCKSINFDRKNDELCFLYRHKSTDDGITFSNTIGLIFTDIDVWPIPGDQCMNQTCDTGRCLSAGTTHVCKTFAECKKFSDESVNTNDTATAAGTFLEITCSKDGTSLVGNSVIECNDDGYWSDNTFCE
ncbi:hypothetical protein ACF0H5_010409 [Mactra antiquata]